MCYEKLATLFLMNFPEKLVQELLAKARLGGKKRKKTKNLGEKFRDQDGREQRKDYGTVKRKGSGGNLENL